MWEMSERFFMRFRFIHLISLGRMSDAFADAESYSTQWLHNPSLCYISVILSSTNLSRLAHAFSISKSPHYSWLSLQCLYPRFPIISYSSPTHDQAHPSAQHHSP